MFISKHLKNMYKSLTQCLLKSVETLPLTSIDFGSGTKEGLLFSLKEFPLPPLYLRVGLLKKQLPAHCVT